MVQTIRQCVAATLTVAAVMGATTASAQTSSWTVSFDLGNQLPLSGDVHSSGSGTVLGLPTQVATRTYDDVYGAGFSWAAGVGYRLGSRSEIRVQGSYTSNPADRLQVGTVAGLPLFGLFDDYTAFGMDFGYRQYLATSKVRPFVGAHVGVVRLEAVQSEFSVPAANVVLPNVNFLDTSTVPAFGGSAGVMFDVSDHFAFQGGIDFRWHGDAADLDGLAGTGLEGINDETRRWAMPITAGITVKF
jgi:hypothetical protein